MILSDHDLKEKIASKEIEVTPLQDFQIQPASIDLTLGNEFLLPNHSGSEPVSLENPSTYQIIHADRFVIEPKKFLLARTKEQIKLPNDLTAFVEGRSSIGRLGLFIQNAGWVDPGFYGTITLELFNASDYPIELIADRRICQIVIAKTSSLVEKPYQGKYQGQIEPTASKIFLDQDNGSTH